MQTIWTDNLNLVKVLRLHSLYYMQQRYIEMKIVNGRINIVYKDIILRDYKEEDIIDDIWWMTEEIAWHEWDAPWEAEEDLNNFDAEKYYQKEMKKLKDKKVIRGNLYDDLTFKLSIKKFEEFFCNY